MKTKWLRKCIKNIDTSDKFFMGVAEGAEKELEAIESMINCSRRIRPVGEIDNGNTMVYEYCSDGILTIKAMESTITAQENKIYELEDKERQLVDMIDAREDYIDTLEDKLKGTNTWLC